VRLCVECEHAAGKPEQLEVGQFKHNSSLVEDPVGAVRKAGQALRTCLDPLASDRDVAKAQDDAPTGRVTSKAHQRAETREQEH